MSALPELQTAFKQAVFGDGQTNATIESAIATGGLTAAEKVSIHRNNTFLTLTDSLTAVFPVVARLVGEEFFAATAREFIQRCPPRHASLLFYGGGFGDFLDGFAPAASLPYLGDVARLEWAWHEAFHAGDAKPLAADDLQRLAVESLGRLKLTPHPSAGLLISDYPTAAIWQANQSCDGDPETINLDAGGCTLLVIRPALDVEVRILKPGVHALLSVLISGGDLTQAHAGAVAVDENFDFESAIADLIGGGTFTSYFQGD
ncbi:MAG: DUF2063 domain-containing protein [Rhodospirillaceae bacterium]|nr:DUF2063 domain-containing protein [Rhodospirillaceae bacterium]